jgi:phosphoenolpyruvate synthase/pyruvate phosphate dikinase
MEYIIKPKKIHSTQLVKADLALGSQPLVERNQKASGVISTVEDESGFDQIILIKATYGSGGALIQNQEQLDKFYVFKPALQKKHFSIIQHKLGEKTSKLVYSATSKNKLKTVALSKLERARYCLTDDEIETLARYALKLEKHYGRPMELEWAKEGKSGTLYLLQAKPKPKTAYLKKSAAASMPKLPVKMCINIGSPENAFSAQFLPNDGVGLARLEFIIGKMIGLHPMAALSWAKLPQDLKKQIQELIIPYTLPVDFYLGRLQEGIATLAAAFYPKEVIFRFSDFTSK